MTQSRDSLEVLENLGPQIVFGFDLQGQCTFSVGRGLAALGLKPGELQGQNLLEYYAKHPSVVAALERARSGEAFRAEDTMHGRLLWTSYEPIHGADGALESVVGATTDATEFVQARADVSRFKALADGSPDFVAVADTKGRLTYTNPRVSALDLSFGDADLLAAVVEMLGESRATELVGLLASGSRWSGDLEMRLPSGDVVVHAHLFPLYDADGAARLGTGWIAQDITALRESETTLQATNADLKQFQALVEASSDFIAIAGMDAGIRYLNPAARNLAGVPPGLDVSTTVISDYLTPEAVVQSEQVEQPAVLATGRWAGESTLCRADNTVVPVEVVSFIVPDPDTGRPMALATVQRDITERLAATAAQEEFVALVAHELRTPLASVKGYVEIASESQHDLARLSAHLQVASRNIVRMERLVEQILRVAGEDRHHPDRRHSLDLVGVVEQAVESARPGIEGAGLRFEFRTCPPIMVALDETFVEVIDNLISNAAKYTPSGGQIVVSVDRVDDDAVLTITDTGSGIPLDERERIFDKFVRGDRVGRQSIPGLGLGLFITRAIVQSHDGDIRAHERPGGGAKFVVRLPVAPDRRITPH